MFKQMILASAIALGVLAIGCEKEESSKTSTPSAPAAPSTPSASATTAPSAAAPAIPSMNDMKSAASSATQQAGAAVSTAAPSDVPAASATTAPAAGAAAADSQAQKLIDQAMQYVKDNKYDLADKALTQADGMKSSLSPTLQSALEKAHSAVSAAKAAGGTGIKLPGQ